MKTVFLIATIVALAGCGSSTDTSPTRYNFKVVDGLNQSSTAGAAALGKPITSQLARDPNGKFAGRFFDFLKPALAYAQTLTVSGTPVAGAIVCGRESNPGEPKVVPLCAFTLADGKAVNAVEGGTKAGTYNILFTAQVPSQQPVKDSTTVTVTPGAADPNRRVGGSDMAASVDTLPASAVRDAYGNSVPFRIQSDTIITVAGNVAGTVDARRFTFKVPVNVIHNVYTPILDANGVQIAVLDYTLYAQSAGGGWTWTTWGLSVAPR